MLQTEQFQKDLVKLEKERNVDKCLDYIKHLMIKATESNALGRASDKVLAEYLDKDKLAEVHGKTVRKAMLEGDEYTAAEHEFIRSLTWSDEEF